MITVPIYAHITPSTFHSMQLYARIIKFRYLFVYVPVDAGQGQGIVDLALFFTDVMRWICGIPSEKI